MKAVAFDYFCKKSNMKKNFIYVLFCFLVFVSACGEDDASLPAPSDSFDRSALLVNWADNIIIPAYDNFATTLNVLVNASQSFADTPTSVSLEEVRTSWLTAYSSFQKVSMFEIGRAETLNYRNRLNVYPTNTAEIDGYISSNSWDFALPSTIDSQGFPALDYLLYGLGTDQEILDQYTTGTNALSYKMYLLDLVTTMQTLTNEVTSDWENGYRETYITNTSSSASGAVDQTVNSFLFYYEKSLRAGKVGIPAGVFSGSPLPQNVESLHYEFISKQLLLEALSATISFFNGEGFTSDFPGNGFGLSSYLDALNTVKNGSDLSVLINNQFQTASAKIALLDNSFVEQISTDNTKMLETYDELQRNVILMKVDMLQALSIDVDYVDADGD
ncbi:MAG: hypothetical protein ACI9R6_000465 [Saprospiraceae bacterium]|jgi:hypothetical protein